MFAPTVCIIVLLLCNCVSSDDLILSRAVAPTPVPDVKECTAASECITNRLCASCSPGRGPTCTTAECVNQQCKLIAPCSLYTTTLATNLGECENDGQCVHPEICAVECKEGLGPLCATAKCVNKKCQTISPCSQKSQCTDKDLSQCVIPQLCELCVVGRTPPCSQASCENGQCKTITPCSLPVPSTTKPPNTCTCNNQCPSPKFCATKCPDGTTPVCASAKCVDGKCITIRPCSQHICKTAATCPYNKQNCVPCPFAYGPGCEQAACSNGICSIVPPCSKKTNIVMVNLATQGTLKSVK